MTFLKILHSNPLYWNVGAFYKDAIAKLWPLVENEIYSLRKAYRKLGFPENGDGVNGFFSRNMSFEDLAIVKMFAEEHNMDMHTVRVFKSKTIPNQFTLRIASFAK